MRSAEALRPTGRRIGFALGPTRELLDELQRRGVRYCHWKGSISLDRVLAGEKDVDLLVDWRSSADVGGILAQTGFRRAVDAPAAALPGIDHYLALDEKLGLIAHLHLHWQLIPTKDNPDRIRLPWEELVLATRVHDASHGIFTPAPDVELLLFLVRAAMRATPRRRVAEALGRPFLGAAAVSELRWLAERTSRQALSARGTELIGTRGAAKAVAALDAPASSATFHALRAAIEPALASYESGRIARAMTRSAARTRHTRRTLPNGGRIIAFLGSDGAGKSTVVRAVTAWLGSELEVHALYLGSGDGATSPLRRVLRNVDRVRRILLPRRVSAVGSAGDHPTAAYVRGEGYVEGVRPGLRALWKVASKLALAREKRERLVAAWRGRTKGAVIICDRYPQTQQLGFNDGPQLSPWLHHPQRWLRSAARREHAAYDLATTLAPDLVIKLVVSPETAATRKDDMSVDLLRARASSIRGLSFPAATRVVEIDADQPLESVLVAARTAIWSALWQ